MPESFSYRDAGVDIDREAEGIRALIAALTYRRKGSFSMMGGVGHFAGLIDFGDLSLALTVDGVGTKMLVADRERDWSTVGIDCIAMNVNDLYVMNLEPVAFVDYIATDSISLEKMAQIGRGLNEGARLANIDIIGGETATLKNLVQGLDQMDGLDAAGRGVDGVGREVREADVPRLAQEGLLEAGLVHLAQVHDREGDGPRGELHLELLQLGLEVLEVDGRIARASGQQE